MLQKVNLSKTSLMRIQKNTLMNINNLFVRLNFPNKDALMKVLEFEILERKYQISCPDKEEEILKACVALDSRMKSLKTQGNFAAEK